MYAGPQARPRAIPAITAGVALGGLSALYFVNPNTTHVPLCPLHAMTGLWCPICGATRATYALLHGDLLTALHDNALYVLVLALLLVLAVARLRLGAGASSGRLLPRPAFWALVGLGLIFGVVRNLSVGSWLAPPV